MNDALRRNPNIAIKPFDQQFRDFLITLPPCSRELNPVEKGWEYHRKNKLANRL